MTKKITKKKQKRNITSWNISVYASYNNTIVTFAKDDWDVIAWATAWSSGFKWARKSTPYAGQIAAQKAAEKAKTYWFEEGTVYIRWVWPWREQAVRWLISSWIEIKWIIDRTPIPHNGCRARKRRRV